MACYHVKTFFLLNVFMFLLLSSDLLSSATENSSEKVASDHISTTDELIKSGGAVEEKNKAVSDEKDPKHSPDESHIDFIASEEGQVASTNDKDEFLRQDAVDSIEATEKTESAEEEPEEQSSGKKTEEKENQKPEKEKGNNRNKEPSQEAQEEPKEAAPEEAKEPAAVGVEESSSDENSTVTPPEPPTVAPPSDHEDANIAPPVIKTGEAADGSHEHLAPSPPPPEEDMQTFDEWKQKVINEKQNKPPADPVKVNTVENGATKNGGNGHVKTAAYTKNFASFDCGAKVLDASKAAQSRDSILNPDRDKYMNIPCEETDKWVVIELCEPIQVKMFEISSFELFSSLIANFTVLASDRFPTRDWKSLGDFTAKNERTIQSFQISDQMYTKYLKVVYTGHYGNEHYCPVSLIRVFGLSIEVDESEEGEDDESGDSNDQPIEAPSEPEKSNHGNGITNTVINIVKKVITGGGNDKKHNPDPVPEDKAVKRNETVQQNKDKFDHPREPTPFNTNQTDIPFIEGNTVIIPPNVTILSKEAEASLINVTRNATGSHCVYLDAAICDEELEGLLCSSALNRYMNALGAFNATCCSATATRIEPEVVKAAEEAPSKTENTNGAESASLATSSQKESLLMRLRNKVKELEFNMSLSGEYLEALSKRYKKQMDDITARHNQTLTRLLSTNEEAAARDVRHSQRITDLETTIARLLDRLEAVEEEVLGMNESLLSRHYLLVGLEFGLFLLMVLVYLKKLSKLTADQSTSCSVRTEVDSSNGSEANSSRTVSDYTEHVYKRSVGEWTTDGSIEELIVPQASFPRRQNQISDSRTAKKNKKCKAKKERLGSLDLDRLPRSHLSIERLAYPSSRSPTPASRGSTGNINVLADATCFSTNKALSVI